MSTSALRGMVFAAILCAPVGAARAETPICSADNRQVSPAVASDGGVSLAVWFDERNGWDLHGALLDAGEPVEPTDLLISGANASQSNPSIAFTGEHFMTVWDDGRSGRYTQLYVARVSRTGEVLDPDGALFSLGPHHQNHPELGWGDGQGLVVFQDYRAGSWDIYGARITPEGVNLDPEGIPVAVAQGDSLWAPDVAWGQSSYLVVWQDTRGTYYDIFAARVDAQGQLLDAEPIVVSSEMPRYQNAPRVAYGAGVFLVVWDDGVTIWSRRLGADGALIDAQEQVVCDAYGYQNDAAVAFGGGQFLVAWSDARSGEPDLSVARIDPVDGLLDPGGVSRSSAPGYQYEPDVSFGQGGFEVVWTDTRSGTYGHDVYGTVVDPDDIDADGFANLADTCPALASPEQADTDSDGVGDVCDVCPATYDPDQTDSDADGVGDACELSGCASKGPPTSGGLALGLGGLCLFWRRRRA